MLQIQSKTRPHFTCTSVKTAAAAPGSVHALLHRKAGVLLEICASARKTPEPKGDGGWSQPQGQAEEAAVTDADGASGRVPRRDRAGTDTPRHRAPLTHLLTSVSPDHKDELSSDEEPPCPAEPRVLQQPWGERGVCAHRGTRLTPLHPNAAALAHLSPITSESLPTCCTFLSENFPQLWKLL